MPTKREPPAETPRTDLTPEREPYYEGYFGTEEEEGVVREEEAGDAEKPDRRGPGGATPEPDRGASRKAAEDAAGGDREIS